MADTNEPPDETTEQGSDVDTEQTSFDASMGGDSGDADGEEADPDVSPSEGSTPTDSSGGEGVGPGLAETHDAAPETHKPETHNRESDQDRALRRETDSAAFDGEQDAEATESNAVADSPFPDPGEASPAENDRSQIEDMLLDDGDEEAEGASPGLFDDLLSGKPIFENKEVLRPSYTPRKLPHREEQINNMATILVSALRGDTPSNILIYGKTGTGKTASAKFVSDELESTSQKYEVPCEVEYINCEVTDTQYRVLAQLANKFIDKNRTAIDDDLTELTSLRDRAREQPSLLGDTGFEGLDAVNERIEALEAERDSFDEVPMTGWPTDRVYNSFFDAVDYRERVVVIMLDEIDKLVEKSGDDTLYNLSRMNSELQRSRVSIIGISNDLKFTDFLDPRVKSSLGEEEIVFPPYDANQLRDILEHRAEVAFKESALTDDVIPLCAAFAAQEHGDARRALDLLRTAGELAERDDTDNVEEDHVRQAQEKIELDRVVEVVRTLPQQSKLVLFAIILLEKQGVHNINTGEVYNIYKRLCEEIDADVLTQRRVTDLISELDMLGIVNAVVVSKGRYGRTKEISLSVPVEETEAVLLSDSRLGDIEDAQPFVQARFDN